jgi:hypothetical protein
MVVQIAATYRKRAVLFGMQKSYAINYGIAATGDVSIGLALV